MSDRQPNLIYVWDAYCGWCYGFTLSLRSFHEKHPELPLTVLSGGLFVGERKQPIGAFTYIPEANKRISELTGVTFGTAYEELFQDGTTVMDSEEAAVGFTALRSLAPERAVYLASAMQRSFYHSGKSLHRNDEYIKIGGGAMTVEKLEAHLSAIIG